MDSNQESNLPHEKPRHQNLVNLISDYKFYSEGSLHKQLYKSLLLSFGNLHPECREHIEREEPLLKGSTSQIEDLEANFRQEITPLSLDFSEAFRKLKSAKSEAQKYQSLSLIKSKYERVDVHELERLVRKAKEAKGSIEGKDVILIIGSTGSGKTTNILKFLGYNLKESSIKGISTLTPVEQLSKQHESFKTSPEGASVTRYINAAPIPDKMYQIGTPNYKKTFYICDSPGFGDSAGLEVDIANGVGLMEALKGCRSLRVVLLLPYATVTADKGSGLQKITATISKIFSEFEDFERSLTVLFNKVPKDQIESTHNFVQNNIKYVKVDSKTLQVFKVILQSAKNQDNFIYPLQKEYKNLFKIILTRTDPIVNLDNITYKLAASTETLINIYINQKFNRIREDFENRKYLNAKEHLQLLSKLKDILYTHQKLDQKFKSICNIINNEVSRQFTEFKKMTKQYFKDGKNRNNKIDQIKSRISNITLIINNFGIKASFEGKLQQINQQLERSGQDYQLYFQSLEESQKIAFLSKVRVFSGELSVSSLRNRFLTKMEALFEGQANNTKRCIKEQASSELQASWQNLTTLQKQLLALDENHCSSRQLANIRRLLVQLFQKCEGQIRQNIIDRPKLPSYVALYEKQVSKCKKELQMMKVIEMGMNCDGTLKKALASCVKGLQNKYVHQMEELQNQFIQLISKEAHQFTSSFSATLKLLSTSFAQLQFLLSLIHRPYFSPQLTISKLTLILQENAEKLCRFITDMRRFRLQRIDNQFKIIKNNSNVLLKCCEILKIPQLLQKIKGQIHLMLKGHFEYEKANFSKSTIKLTSNILNDLQKWVKNYNKLMVFTKFQHDLGPQIKNIIEEISKQFYNNLKTPFLEYTEKDLKRLQEKDHYRHIPLTLPNFEKICIFSLKIDQVFQNQLHLYTREEQKKVQKIMQIYLNQLLKQAWEFNHNQFDNFCKPKNLQYIIKVLLQINSKQHVCRYITYKISTPIVDTLERAKEQLHEVQRRIQDKFEACKGIQHNIDELYSLSHLCKFYGPIEDVFRSKDNDESFNFKDLQVRINQTISHWLDGYEQIIKGQLQIQQLKEIDFAKVKRIYQEICLMKTPESDSKRFSITSYFEKVQKRHIQNLKILKRRLAEEHVNILNEDNKKLDIFVSHFNQAVLLERKLSIVFEDNKGKILIQISKSLSETANLWLKIFEASLSDMLSFLNDYSLDFIEKNIEKFKTFEEKLYCIDYFKQDNTIQGSFNNQIPKSFSTVIETSQAKLIELMKLMEIEPTSSKQNLQKLNRQASLSEMLSNFFQSLKKSAKERYCEWSQNFVVDIGFKKYYVNFRDGENPDKLKIKKQLESNVKRYFDGITQKYKEECLTQIQEAAKLAQKIKNSINNLPFELKKIYSDCLSTKQEKMEVKQASNGVKSKNDLVRQYFQEYFKKNNDSCLKIILEKKYNNNQQKMIQQMLEEYAFQDFKSIFYENASQNEKLNNKFKQQIKKNYKINFSFLEQYKAITQIQKRSMVYEKVKRSIKAYSAKRQLK